MHVRSHSPTCGSSCECHLVRVWTTCSVGWGRLNSSTRTRDSPVPIACADLFVMTSQGAVLARPASTVRAGEERWVAKRLADIGIPVIKILTGQATFEGADLMWIDQGTAVIGKGLRTNQHDSVPSRNSFCKLHDFFDKFVSILESS